MLNVAPNGTASYVGTYPIANVAGFPCGLAINPAGTFLYVVSYAQFRSRITVHNVNGASGALTQVQTMPFPFNTEGTTIGANAKNGIVYLVKGSTHYLYVVNEAGGLGNELEVFTVNPATGLLSSYFGRGLPASGIAEGDLIAPRLVANAAGTRLYLSIQRTSAVMCMEVQPNGIPNDVSYVALLATASGAVAVDPTDSYLYAGTTNGNVVKFSISPTGTLTRIASFSTGAGAGPVSGLAMHPNGQSLLATSIDGFQQYHLSVIDLSTMLPVAGSPLSSTAPLWGIDLNATGSLIFVARNEGASANIYSLPIVNTPPTFQAPASIEAECFAGGANVTLSATVQDADFDPITVTWLVDGVAVQSSTVVSGSTVTLLRNYTLGSHTVNILVSDPTGSPVTADVSVTVSDNTAAIILLVGPAEMTIECHAGFTDPGATAWDGCYGNLTQDIEVTGAVDPNQVGDYQLVYSVTDPMHNESQSKTRTVHVVDTTPPDVALNGDWYMYVYCGDPFSDPGATAYDDWSGDLTAQIQVGGGVEAHTFGWHQITYSATDEHGNTGTAERWVHVAARVSGFSAPMAELVPHWQDPPMPEYAFQRGRTIPLRLQLLCGDDPFTGGEVAPPEIAWLLRDYDEFPVWTIDPDSGLANDDGLAFRSAGSHWEYNLSTRDMTVGTYVIFILMPDGLVYSARFALR